MRKRESGARCGESRGSKAAFIGLRGKIRGRDEAVR
jgi:hypothetical protein